MSIEQARPYELPLWDGTIDPTQIYITVDYNGTWVRPKRYPLSGIISGDLEFATTHIEKGRLTGLSNRYVEVTFDSAFDEIPVGRKNLNVYRVNEDGGGTGKATDDEVLIYGLGVTVSGFSFYIDDTEDLSGVIVEYLFI